MSEEVTLRVSRRDAGRILGALRERLKKAERGVSKFGDAFDPEKGANILETRESHRALIHSIQEQM